MHTPTIRVIGFKRVPGLCREYYKEITDGRKKGRVFCTQPDPQGNSQWYRCSQDGEPSHPMAETLFKPEDTTFL